VPRHLSRERVRGIDDGARLVVPQPVDETGHAAEPADPHLPFGQRGLAHPTSERRQDGHAGGELTRLRGAAEAQDQVRHRSTE
jgi:hypothetical protein